MGGAIPKLGTPDGADAGLFGKKLRIVVVGINYSPETIGTGKYNTEMCRWFVSRGHAVRVITAPPYYPNWKVQPGYKRYWFSKEFVDGVEVIRCPIWVPKNPTGVARLLHLFTFGLSSIGGLAYSLAWRPDRVVCVAPTLASAFGSSIYAIVLGAKRWLHIQDFELDAAAELGLVRGTLATKVLGLVESAIFRKFEVVSSISPKMVSRLAAKRVPEFKRYLFPNWVDTIKIAPLDSVSKFRARLSIPAEAIVALYSGNMGKKQGLELIAKAAKELRKDERIHFVFGGEGPALAELKSMCKGLKNVHFLPLQPESELVEWLGLADVHLLPQRPDVADLVMPSKLTGMFASGRPVLATAGEGTDLALGIESKGIVVPPDDLGAFRDALLLLANQPQMRLTMGAAGREFAISHLSIDSTLTSFEKRLQAGR